jgi:hypothetical protein
MRPLHHHYHNLGAWLSRKEGDALVWRYDVRGMRTGGIGVAVACVTFGVGMWILLREKPLAWAFFAIGVVTAIGVAGLFWFYAAQKEKSGAILEFRSSIDTVTIPPLGMVVAAARAKVQFSYEIYRSSDHELNSELNCIIEGVRRPFLAAAGSGGPLRKLAEELETNGFAVTVFNGTREEAPNQPSQPTPLKRRG